MDNINPINMALAVILASIDSLLWVINELLGLHDQETALEEPTAALSPSSGPIPHNMTKRQLQALTGVKSSRYNKQALLELALTM